MLAFVIPSDESPVKQNCFLGTAVAVLAFASFVTLGAFAQKHHAKQDKPAAEPPPAAAEVQPAQETIDLGMYQRIMDEGFNHSHVMDYASALDGDIGPRLTGSPCPRRARGSFCIQPAWKGQSS
jgi:hypothetical protein